MYWKVRRGEHMNKNQIAVERGREEPWYASVDNGGKSDLTSRSWGHVLFVS
jgi:hypothetical protein